ncbi:methyltransferase domain-containing protein [Fulvimarina sp. 2208YS6-2-32]|uniref:Methyltransferase domain-containing protein n=1 Tax=Fulvimarina uroteuthidis TaxID=3098149 RepID=A0ABU5I2G1_9HYPH|nr:methyltransferase domain-containing protein [Fulvimarina sp. 2208YS6-2-32]MDY8108351.1 methyltransferase domain-containing protein [Fulvimarina sp. 2208YS6-2-32]
MTDNSKILARDGRNGDFGPFFANWIRHPIAMGAVAPSSRSYCRTMVEKSSVAIEGPILELGPGLGAVTRALLEKGVDPSRITSIEYSENFADALKQRFPEINVIQGDGFDLDKTLGERRNETFAAILFAIPIVSQKASWRQNLFRDYFSRLRSGGNITQLSYMWKPPVPAVPGVFSVSSSDFIWDNIPPARVWIYERDLAFSEIDA